MIRHNKTDHKAYQEQEPADFRLCKWGNWQNSMDKVVQDFRVKFILIV